MQTILTRRVALYALYLTNAAVKEARGNNIGGQIVAGGKTYYSVLISLLGSQPGESPVLWGTVNAEACPDPGKYLGNVTRKEKACRTGQASDHALHMAPAVLTDGMFLWAGGIKGRAAYVSISAFAELVDLIFARMLDGVLEGLTKEIIRRVKHRDISDLADLDEPTLTEILDGDIFDQLGLPLETEMIEYLNFTDASEFVPD